MFHKTVTKAKQGYKLNFLESIYFFHLRPWGLVAVGVWLLFVGTFIRDVSEEEFDKRVRW